MSGRKSIIIWTDGSYLPNDRIGGWAILVFDPAKLGKIQLTQSSAGRCRSPLEAELRAIELAIAYSDKATIYTDNVEAHRIMRRTRKRIKLRMVKDGPQLDTVHTIAQMAAVEAARRAT